MLFSMLFSIYFLSFPRLTFYCLYFIIYFIRCFLIIAWEDLIKSHSVLLAAWSIMFDGGSHTFNKTDQE